MALIALGALMVALALSLASQRTRLAAPIAGHTSSAAKVPAFVRSLRPNYPYSVIPGGAYSQPELRFANQHDPLVREHYTDFDVQAARLVTLTADRYQYVSYRTHNHIYWTKKRLRIPKGEVLLTDGTHYARARCGNRLASTPQKPTSELQPPDTALELPPFTPGQIYNLQLADRPPDGELAQQFPALPFEFRLAPLIQKGVESGPRLPAPWPGLNQFFPVVFAGVPGTLRQPSNSPPGNNLPAESGVTPTPVVTNTPPGLALIPEPATIGCLAAGSLVMGLLFGQVARRKRRHKPLRKT